MVLIRVEYVFLGAIILGFVVIVSIYAFKISLVNTAPVLILFVLATIGILTLKHFSDKGSITTHNNMTPFQAIEFVKTEWEKQFKEKINMVDSGIKPFYIPGTGVLFYAIRIRRPDSTLVPVVLEVPKKHLYYELYPTPSQIDDPSKIIVPEGITTAPVEKFSQEAMKDYWKRRGTAPQQVFNVGSQNKRDEMDKLRNNRESSQNRQEETGDDDE